MKDFIELLVERFGLPDFLATYVMLVFYVLLGLFSGYRAIKYVRSRIKSSVVRKMINADLHPFFTHNEIIKYTKFYIPQYFQNITPSEGEELGRIHGAAARSKLMPEFISKGLLTESPVKYFIILADTGMGKTAFLINLFRKYKGRKTSLKEIKYEIALFPLGDRFALDRINQISNKNNTILLLDAFDEDVKAVQDYRTRMIEILDAVKDFRKIIFTCRTQFFPNKQEEPNDTNDITFGDNIHHKIQKIYLSAFDDRDIIRYLIRKYDLNIYKFIRAYQLVKKCPSLMFRPMLLTYIDDLVKGKLLYHYSYEMYEVLIEKWVEREGQKPAILSRNYGKNYPERLLIFSKALAQDLYERRAERQGYFITIEELKKNLATNLIDTTFLSLEDKTGRSLLNRNSMGQFKFAHKSILEYFLALRIYEDPSFFNKFDFHGMDATLNFHLEMLANLLTSLDGKFWINDDVKFKSLSNVSPKHIKSISKIVISKASSNIGKNIAGLSNVKQIIFTDQSFLVFYVLYLFICYERDMAKINLSEAEVSSFNKSIDDYRGIIREINKMIPKLTYNYVKLIVENCDIEKSLKLRFLTVLDSAGEGRPPSYLELSDLRSFILKGRSEKALLMQALYPIKEFSKLKKYLSGADLVF